MPSRRVRRLIITNLKMSAVRVKGKKVTSLCTEKVTLSRWRLLQLEGTVESVEEAYLISDNFSVTFLLLTPNYMVGAAVLLC